MGVGWGLLLFRFRQRNHWVLGGQKDLPEGEGYIRSNTEEIWEEHSGLWGEQQEAWRWERARYVLEDNGWSSVTEEEKFFDDLIYAIWHLAVDCLLFWVQMRSFLFQILCAEVCVLLLLVTHGAEHSAGVQDLTEILPLHLLFPLACSPGRFPSHSLL